jgi:hypothetical protein
MARARALMNNAGFTSAKQNNEWCEAANTATALDSIIVWKEDISTKFYAFFGKELAVSMQSPAVWQNVFWKNVCHE